MELYIFLFCLSLLFLLLKPFLRRYSTTNLPPGPSSLPLIGSLHRLSPRLHESLYNLAKIHGPLMTIYLGSIITIVVSSPEIAKQVLQIHDQDFSERYVPDVITAQPNPESTLAWVPGNQRWRNRRRICTTQMFTKQRLDSQHHLRQLKVRQLIEHIKKHYFLGKHVDIGQVAFATTLNLISNTIFSVDIIDPGFEKAQEFKDLVWRIMEDAGKQNLSDIFPVLKFFDLQGLKRHIRPAYMRLHEIFDEMIEKRLESRKIGNERSGDFLDVLLDQCAEQGSDFDRHNIKPLILDLFIAGSDTSAITTEWAMTELLRNPEVLQKLRRELIEVIGADRAMQDSDIDQLPYLQAVVKETLRFHPPVPLLLPYKAVNNVEILGFNIPKNSRVLVNAWAVARDPKYWNNNPLSFSPERFLGSSNVDFKGRDFEYIPFGAGRRICPGLPLATRMVHLILGSIVHEFDWKLPEGVVSPMDLDMGELLGATLKKAVPLCAIPHPRQGHLKAMLCANYYG